MNILCWLVAGALIKIFCSEKVMGALIGVRALKGMNTVVDAHRCLFLYCICSRNSRNLLIGSLLRFNLIVLEMSYLFYSKLLEFKMWLLFSK